VGELTKALRDLESLGIATDDTPITSYVHVGIENSSARRFEACSGLERELISLLRQICPDAEDGGWQMLNLTEICQMLRNSGHRMLRPDIVETYLRGLSFDGRDQDGGKGNIRLRKISRNVISMRLERSWETLERAADIRRQGAGRLLGHLVGRVEKGKKGIDLQVETTLGALRAMLPEEAFAQPGVVKNVQRLMDRALLWLHEHSVVTLGKGLTVFRSAMTLQLDPELRGFQQKDFLALEEHYEEQAFQVHVMAEYAQRGLDSMPEALRLSEDYFTLDKAAFVRRWMPGRSSAELRRQTTPASWDLIVTSLGNAEQEKIVADDREQTNVLVLAGPGSGKTKVLVHRIAYLIRVRRENPNGILVLTYNRHAAAEIRERLRALVGDEASHVMVYTCHALAMRLMGFSFAGKSENEASFDFDSVIDEAVRQLTGRGLSRAEAEALRDTLIQGYRWLLVDEYQDIGKEEYDLIAAVAGRSINDPDLKLSLFAVGDDDQNIYAFSGASVRYIRRFEQDYSARLRYLTENYRSTRALIDSANRVIAPAEERMKSGHDIRIDRSREMEVAGGEMAELDPVARGRVQVLRSTDEVAQAVAAVDELRRLSLLIPDWSWESAAIIAREWRYLDPVRSYAEAKGIPVELASDSKTPCWRLREMQEFIAQVRQSEKELLSLEDLLEMHKRLPENKWSELVGQGLLELRNELADKAWPEGDVVEWFGEWSREIRGMKKGLLLLTAHRAKGLEFDHVVALDGKWGKRGQGEDPEAPRRLFYVASTRAKKTFAALAMGPHPFLDPSGNPDLLVREPHVDPGAMALCDKRYQAAGPKSIDLSFPGRLHKLSPSLAALRRANIGDAITLANKDGRWIVQNSDGVKIGSMSRAYLPPKGAEFLSGEIGAMIRWRRSDGDQDYQDSIKRDEWDVVLPDLVFRAVPNGKRRSGKQKGA